MKFFPNMPCEVVIKRVKESWEFIKGFPFPKFEMKCPICGSEELQLRYIQFAKRDKGGCKYRANVAFKCTKCSHNIVFGLVIPEEIYRIHIKGDIPVEKTYHYREVYEVIKND